MRGERAKEYTLPDASLMRKSQDSLLNMWENTHVTRGIISIFLWNTRWCHSCSRGEASISLIHRFFKKSFVFLCLLFGKLLWLSKILVGTTWPKSNMSVLWGISYSHHIADQHLVNHYNKSTSCVLFTQPLRNPKCQNIFKMNRWKSKLKGKQNQYPICNK